jgi:hypothetical protein
VSALIDAANNEPNENVNRELGYAWDKFRREYASHFVTRHSKVMSSPDRKAKLNETLKSEEWAEFDILSRLPGFDQRFAAASARYRSELAELECSIDPRALLDRQPYCHCSFTLNGSSQADLLPAALNDNVRAGLASFRRVLSKNGEDLARSIDKLTENTPDPDLEAAAREVAAAFRSGREIPRFNDLQLKILVEVLTDTSPAHPAEPTRTESRTAQRPGDPARSFSDMGPAEHAEEPLLLNV